MALLALALEVDDVLVDRVLCLVDVLDEVPDAAVVVELLPVLALALVDEHDPQATRQERGLPQALGQRLLRPFELLEDLGVGRKLIVVPVAPSPPIAAVRLARLELVVGSPRANSWRQTLPSRFTSATSHSDSALTTETPTPCSPPETL